MTLSACDDDGGSGNDSAGGERAVAGMEIVDTGPEFVPNPNGYITRNLIDNQASGPAFAAVKDMNGDGKLDFIISKFGSVANFAVEPGQITIYYQGESLTDWTQEDVVPDDSPIYWPNSIEVEDVDDDGDLDITVGVGFLICEILPSVSPSGERAPVGPCGGLMWYERDGDQWIRHDVVQPQNELFYHHGIIADIDQDGVTDMFTVGERRYIDDNGDVIDYAEAQWFRGQLMGERFETTPRVIGPGLGSLAYLRDMDGDGDLDAYSAEYFADFDAKSFAWYEQVEAPSEANPAGVWRRHIIDDQVGPAIQLSWVEDLFGDGQPVFIGSNHTQTTGPEPDPWESALYVYDVPEDIRGPWTKRKISNNIVSISRSNQAAPGIFGVGDVNGDGRKDILASGDGDTRVFVLLQDENRNFETWVLDDSLPQAGSMKVVDLDGDGDNELLVSSYDINSVFIYEAEEGGPFPLRVADLPEWAEETPDMMMAGAEMNAGAEMIAGAEMAGAEMTAGVEMASGEMSMPSGLGSWGDTCTGNEECSEASPICVINPMMGPPGYCSKSCTSTTQCSDTIEGWTCNIIGDCANPVVSWCGPNEEIEAGGGVLVECP